MTPKRRAELVQDALSYGRLDKGISKALDRAYLAGLDCNDEGADNPHDGDIVECWHCTGKHLKRVLAEADAP